MGAPILTADDFTNALLALLPSGKVWPRDLDSKVRAAMAGMSPTYARNLNSANGLLVDSFPLTTVQLLPEWEASLGLPDPCAGQSPTIEARRAQVVARFAGTGGQTKDFFIAYALALGYTITITEFAPFRVGFNAVGDPLYGPEWAYVWQINAPLNTIQWFRVSESAVGEPLAYWSNTVLECELNAVKPAHLVLIFSYS
jgi:uncharacterized protein YmfQ (DUF2313 family)